MRTLRSVGRHQTTIQPAATAQMISPIQGAASASTNTNESAIRAAPHRRMVRCARTSRSSSWTVFRTLPIRSASWTSNAPRTRQVTAASQNDNLGRYTAFEEARIIAAAGIARTKMRLRAGDRRMERISEPGGGANDNESPGLPEEVQTVPEKGRADAPSPILVARHATAAPTPGPSPNTRYR